MADHTKWRLTTSPRDPTRVDAIDPEMPDDVYRIANCWSGPFAPTREIAAANARRIVAAWNAVQGIRTEHVSLLDSVFREAKILAEHCRECGKTGRNAAGGQCVICGPMRWMLTILKKIGEGGRDG